MSTAQAIDQGISSCHYGILQLRMHFVHLSVIVGLSQLRHYPDKCMRRSESGSVRQMPTVPQPFFWRASLAASSAVGFYASDYGRSEEHTSELQSHSDLVCRLLLVKKNN